MRGMHLAPNCSGMEAALFIDGTSQKKKFKKTEIA
jgi:hypothetical protein